MKKIVLKFERAFSKNQELRIKFAHDPLKFIDSETDLDEEINNMMKLSAAPELYSHLVALGTTSSVLSLLTHENTDIALIAVQLLNEWTDDDVVAEATEEGEKGMKALVDDLLEKQVLELLIENLQRLNDTDDNPDDRQGVFNTLSVIENLISVDPTISETVVSKTTLLPWLLQRIKSKTFDSNRQYASELLAILLQQSRPNRLKVGELNGMPKLLQVLASYKKKDPKDGDEIEMMENLFDALCSLVAEPELKEMFLAEEGVELMLIILREKKMARMRALKVLSHAFLGGGGKGGKECCLKFIDNLGLKTLFPIFMKKGIKAYKKEYSSNYSEAEEDEHLVSIISALLKNITDPTIRFRIIHKFVESDFEKLDRLLEMHEHYQKKVASADRNYIPSLDDLDEDEMLEERYLNRLDKGLFTLQLVDYILGVVCVEDLSTGILEHAAMILRRKGESFLDITETVKEYLDNIGDTEDSKDEKANIAALVEKLDIVCSATKPTTVVEVDEPLTQ
ncbi:hypothetical protein HDV05_007667 [Chytridiales sp. JEL 0842]|nr:hypothetical protein HDV05_007667 [Chytridiales sp. JEL 0842]